MRKGIIIKVCALLTSCILFLGIFISGISYEEILDDEVPLGSSPEENSCLLDMADYDLWESGEYAQDTGEKSAHRRRMRTPDPILMDYEEYYIELSEDMRLIFFEYDNQLNYLRCSTLSNGDIFSPGKDTCWFTVTIYRTYSEKSLSPGQWNKLFSKGLIINLIFGNEKEGSLDDVFLMDMSHYALWESGDYSQDDGAAITNKRRLRYPSYIEKRHDSYLVELSENLNIIIFEFDCAMNYLGCQTYTAGDYYVPNSDTVQFTMSLHRTYSEKSMSPGQWKKFMADGVTIRISHGDTSIFELEKDKVLCTTSEEWTSEAELVDALLNNDGKTVATGLWHNLILNEVYHLTGNDLDNGNLTVYVSSSEGSDENHGLSPLYPKASLDAYSGMSEVNILLKCGDTFEMSNTFKAGNNCIYAAYGEGDRPILSFYRELELEFEEVETCENVWVADISMLDICNNSKSKNNCNMGQLLIDGEVNWKRRVGSTKDTFDPAELSKTADGGWAADWNTNQLYIYSEKNPNFCDISYAPPLHAITIDDVKNVVFQGIEITGAGKHGISMENVENVEIAGCYIHHIGGSILVSAGVRYGNAVQLWDGGKDIYIRHNFADWIFDTCYTHQGTSSSCEVNNLFVTNNIGAHSFWGLEIWGDAYSELPFLNIEYFNNIIYDIMDITNPETPMYSNNSGKVIFSDPNMEKEDYVSYRCGYTYNQMSAVNVSNAGTGDPVKVHDNVFWNTNRFLALINNVRSEKLFSCLYDNLFYGETDVTAPALFRYTTADGTKKYLESPKDYIIDSNRESIWPSEEIGDNSAELDELVTLMEKISGTADFGGLN